MAKRHKHFESRGGFRKKRGGGRGSQRGRGSKEEEVVDLEGLKKLREVHLSLVLG